MSSDKDIIPDISKLGIGDQQQNQIPTIKSKTSLLSSSIAAAQLQQQQQQQSLPIFISGKKDVPDEPSLFATSVGDNYSGRLVPSSSAISLFSLNNENALSDDLRYSLQQQSNNYATTPFERKNSLTSLSSQQARNNSVNSLHKQRHQHYMTALTPISSNPSTPNLKKFASQAALAFDKSPEQISSPQQIPIHNSATTFPPEPYLEPTSLGGSPSMFYLSSKTPPASLTNPSYLQNYFKFQQQQQQQQPQQQPGLKIEVHDRSPDLMPIGTPNDMPPMTPLLLNSNLEEFRFTTTSDNTTKREWE